MGESPKTPEQIYLEVLQEYLKTLKELRDVIQKLMYDTQQLNTKMHEDAEKLLKNHHSIF